LFYHGEGETRVWPIGESATEIRWHPVPFEVPKANPDLCSYDPPDPTRCFADIFCSGQVVLPDGRLFVAGGNVEGNAQGGGLSDMFLFNPAGADQDVYPFGWAKSGATMQVDRWYPTLTVIPGATPQASPFGRVLIASGATRTLQGEATPIFELYDPATDQVSTLAIAGPSPFTGSTPIPLYPFMFLLPNGDIFYAGGEGTAQMKGRVLIPDYNNNGTWAWHPREFESAISGGSAVMYAPGKIMKSGGIFAGDPDQRAHQITETIDLSNTPSGAYSNAPDFVITAPMARARHFHTLTLLPDGRVVATGGNSRGNGEAGDHQDFECSYEGNAIAEGVCNDSNLDGTPDPGTALFGCPAVPSYCVDGVSCSLPSGSGNEEGPVPCADVDGEPGPDHASCGAPCSSASDCPPGSTCGSATGQCEMPCFSGLTCGAVVHCTGGGTGAIPRTTNVTRPRRPSSGTPTARRGPSSAPKQSRVCITRPLCSCPMPA
jgi:hypothetical protein